MELATVIYQIATYSGTIKVGCNANDEDSFIIAKAKKKLKQQTGSFPLGYQSFRVVERKKI